MCETTKSRFKTTFGILLILLLFSSQLISPLEFSPYKPTPSKIEAFNRILLSNVPLVCWFVLMAVWIIYWKKKLEIRFTRPSVFTLFAFAFIYLICFFTVYDFKAFHFGDSASNAAYTLGMAKGYLPYVPWTSLGYGKQTFFYVIAMPAFWVFNIWDHLPNRFLEFGNFISMICFYAFLRSIKINRFVALLTSACVITSAALIFWQGDFLRQQIAPAFMFLSLLFFSKSVDAAFNKSKNEFTFYSIMLGISLGLGFNVYDVNYIFGVVVAGIFILQILFIQIRYHAVPWKDFSFIGLFFLSSIAIGTGPLLSYSLKYTHIITARLNRKNINSQYGKFLKYFLNIHWSLYHNTWMSKIGAILVIPGLFFSFLKRYRGMRLVWWISFIALVSLFIASGHQGKRRLVSIVFFEYMFIAIGINFIQEKVLKLSLYHKYLVLILSSVALIAVLGFNIQRSYEMAEIKERRFKTDRFIALEKYTKFLKSKSKNDYIYVYEPGRQPASIYWSGGNPEIYHLMAPHYLNFRKADEKLTEFLEKMSTNQESFTILFLLHDDYPSYLSAEFSSKKDRCFEKIKEIEKHFLNEIERLHISDVELTEIQQKAKFRAHGYSRE